MRSPRCSSSTASPRDSSSLASRRCNLLCRNTSRSPYDHKWTVKPTLRQLHSPRRSCGSRCRTEGESFSKASPSSQNRCMVSGTGGRDPNSHECSSSATENDCSREMMCAISGAFKKWRACVRGSLQEGSSPATRHAERRASAFMAFFGAIWRQIEPKLLWELVGGKVGRWEGW